MNKPKHSPKTLIEAEPERYLVIPMPRPGMGTLRVDGHTLRVRRCQGCGVHTTFPVCPICGAGARTSTPNEASLNRENRPPELAMGQRPHPLPKGDE